MKNIQIVPILSVEKIKYNPYITINFCICLLKAGSSQKKRDIKKNATVSITINKLQVLKQDRSKFYEIVIFIFPYQAK